MKMGPIPYSTDLDTDFETDILHLHVCFCDATRGVLVSNVHMRRRTARCLSQIELNISMSAKQSASTILVPLSTF